MKPALVAVVGIGILGGLAAVGAAQDAPEPERTAKRDATAMYEAFLQGDLETFAKYMYPRVTAMMGGKEKMLAAVQKGMDAVAGRDATLEGIAVAPPRQVVQAGAEMHAILPMRLVAKTPKGDLHMETHLLGVSSDKGKSWTFVDARKLNQDNVRKLFPNFNPELRLPPPKAPRLVQKLGAAPP